MKLVLDTLLDVLVDAVADGLEAADLTDEQRERFVDALAVGAEVGLAAKGLVVEVELLTLIASFFRQPAERRDPTATEVLDRVDEKTMRMLSGLLDPGENGSDGA